MWRPLVAAHQGALAVKTGVDGDFERLVLGYLSFSFTTPTVSHSYFADDMPGPVGRISATSMAWIYESNFLIAGAIPWLMTSRAQLRRYATGFALLSGLSFVIFALFPVASPRPANLEENATLIFITRVDGPLNAFPSLHAGCLVYTIALARRLFGRQLHPGVWAILWVWAMLILFATLATKQHYALDLLAGGLIGWAADWFAWRNSVRGAIASASTRRKSSVASHAG